MFREGGRIGKDVGHALISDMITCSRFSESGHTNRCSKSRDVPEREVGISENSMVSLTVSRIRSPPNLSVLELPWRVFMAGASKLADVNIDGAVRLLARAGARELSWRRWSFACLASES